MKIPKKKSLLPYLLAICALIIWGHNGYKIFRGVFNSDSIPEIADISVWESTVNYNEASANDQLFIYRADYRDPFKDWLRVQNKPKFKVFNNKVSLPMLPSLRLTGIVMDSSGPMAIIETPGGEIKFVREKDIVAGVRIVSIDSSWIICRFEKQKFRLGIR
jgi:hypothetical protein